MEKLADRGLRGSHKNNGAEENRPTMAAELYKEQTDKQHNKSRDVWTKERKRDESLDKMLENWES